MTWPIAEQILDKYLKRGLPKDRSPFVEAHLEEFAGGHVSLERGPDSDGSPLWVFGWRAPRHLWWISDKIRPPRLSVAPPVAIEQLRPFLDSVADWAETAELIKRIALQLGRLELRHGFLAVRIATDEVLLQYGTENLADLNAGQLRGVAEIVRRHLGPESEDPDDGARGAVGR